VGFIHFGTVGGASGTVGGASGSVGGGPGARDCLPAGPGSPFTSRPLIYETSEEGKTPANLSG